MTGDTISDKNPLRQFEEKTIEQLAIEVENQLNTKSDIQIEQTAQRLNKEHKMIHRRDQIVEDLKETS